jgi:tetratricopeptide (TPR) repeat protein
VNILGQVAFARGQYDEADAYFSRTLSVDPRGTYGNHWAPTAPLYGGHLDRAEKKIRAGNQVFPRESMLMSCEALLWAKRGEPRKAEAAIQRALRGKSLIHTHHTWHMLAAAYFRNDPHFQSLRNYSPFPRLMRGLKSELESYKREFGRT